MTAFTDEEGRTLRTAVFGAMVLVSTADPGAVDEESRAGIRAMTALSPALRAVLAAAHPELPDGSVADVEAGVLDALRESVAILAAKAPAEASAFADAVVAVCREVAAADGQVAEAEQAMVAKVADALAAAHSAS
ncbi:hypothetical protein F0L68_16670 [Solihabitans fulvus]|uniref:Tellurite resistance protein TerB n=1 Tax=Solihabitans fulvus TaxID=1892852 RepID=A0A5B2XF45_9PSEU|nr:TerB family tellurite resistance protein [Solihabitans fulvus]KAA2261422.1 hypothetical protein F0L68_16670 [Solihabitans fulvus]